MKTSSLPSTLFGFGVLLAGAMGLVVPGCGDDPACSVGKTECLSDTLARTCAKSGEEREPTWIPFTCSAGSTCQEGAGGPDASAGASDGEAACIGTCTVGAAECITAELSRYCDNGLSWELDPCEVGEECVDGHCQLSGDGGDTVKACQPGAKACAAPNIEKVCDNDGTSWIPVACAPHEVCDETARECVPSPGASCDTLGSGICVDSSTAVRCSALTGGYVQVDCPDGTYCAAGQCRGEICAIGSTCNAANQVVDCIDGVNQTVTQCPSNEVCVQNGDSASCVVPDCVPNTRVCGDASSPGSIDPTTAYSQCTVNTRTGLPEWQLTTCEGNLKCDPTTVASTTPCREECTPGSQTCWNSNTEGVQDGWRECQDDGTWGPIQNCNAAGEAALVCANKPHQEAGSLNEVACADPVCADVWNNLNPVSSTEGIPAVQGTCAGTQIRPCDDEGRLSATAQDCTEGICQVQGTVQEDGLRRGACADVAACEDGESICVEASGNPTSFFRSCVNGVFSSALERCANDDPCFTYVDSEGARSASCGGECAPGWTRCSGTNQVETCGADGTYGSGVACQIGHCEDVGNNQAKCVLDCLPGEFGCDGTTKRASDGLHNGTTHAVTCKPDGTWPSIFDTTDDTYVEVCAGSTTCRVSSRQEGLGCVDCIGPSVLGGNTEGLSDTRCDPTSPTDLQTCTENNAWSATSGCASGTACIGPQPVCGGCTAESGAFISQCSEAAVNNLAETCGGCFVSPVGTITPCSEANLPASLDGGPQTCTDLGFGAPSSWAGVIDCCGSYQTGSVATCETLGHGTASPWGDVADCCSDYQTTTAAGSLAYCAPTG